MSKHKPFGELTRDEKLELMAAWVDGKTIETSKAPDITGWCSPFGCLWSCNIYHRIKPDTPDTINWSHVSPEYKWMARDKNGRAHLFIRQPDLDEYTNEWAEATEDFTWVYCNVFVSYKQGTVDWKGSLVERPV